MKARAAVESRHVTRRSFAKLVVVAGVAAAGGYTLFEYAPWLSDQSRAAHARRPFEMESADAKTLRSSPGAFIVASESEDKTAWVRAGQVYERVALELTSLNIRSAFLNQPIEVADVRTQFQSALGIGRAVPQLLVRFGYADAMPRSLRRPVEQVLA